MSGQLDRAAAILDRACRTTYHEDGEKILVNTYQDVQPHLDYAARLRRENRERGRFAKKGDMRHGMSIPFNVIMMVGQQLGISGKDLLTAEAGKRIWKELHGPDYKNFRTVDGKL